MRYWQVQADLDGAPGRILFGVRAENETSALEEAEQRLGGGVSFWILEIPPPPERLPPERLIV